MKFDYLITLPLIRKSFLRIILLIIILFLLFGVVTVKARYTSKAKCSNFETQKEAQEYFNRTDDFRLDRDADGIACEALP